MTTTEELRDGIEWNFADGTLLKVNYPSKAATKAAVRWTEKLIEFCGLYGKTHPELVQVFLQGILVEHHHTVLARIERKIVEEY